MVVVANQSSRSSDTRGVFPKELPPDCCRLGIPNLTTSVLCKCHERCYRALSLPSSRVLSWSAL
jgi:hypothetical protein